MNSDVFFYSIAGFFAGAYFFWRGFYWLKQKSAIEDTPTSKIRSLAMGLAEIYGKVIPASKVFKSPFTGKDCVYYTYTIEEYRQSGKNSRWVIVDSGKETAHFFVADNTGKVLVDPKGAEIDIPLDFEFQSRFWKDPSPTIKKFLKSRRKSFEGFFGLNKNMRYRERFIAPGDKLFVLGTANDNPFVEEASGKENQSDIMMEKGKSTYYISDRHETELLSQLRWKVLGGLFGGSVLMIASLAVFLFNLNAL